MKVKTIGPVQHDGKDVEVGDTLTLSAKAGQALIDAGAAEVVGTEKAANNNPAPGANSGEGQ